MQLTTFSICVLFLPGSLSLLAYRTSIYAMLGNTPLVILSQYKLRRLYKYLPGYVDNLREFDMSLISSYAYLTQTAHHSIFFKLLFR